MPELDIDYSLRESAFAHVRMLGGIHDSIPSSELRRGFQHQGQRVPLVNPQRGIFKPQAMRLLLSIRTVFPRPGGKVWYDDQRDIHERIFSADESFGYDFMGTNPDAPDNQWMRDAMLYQVPVIYFLGVAPGRYQAIIPTYIVDWDAASLRAQIAFATEDSLILDGRKSEQVTKGASEGTPDYQADFLSATERRYALRSVKQRLHQASFREAVLEAYRSRCAFSGLPEPLLLDAAHIVNDQNEKLGQPIVTNGLPLSKVHHAAFDAHLIGVDPDYTIHVSHRLLDQHDGAMLNALTELDGRKLHLPRRQQDAPSRERLEVRFSEFKTAA